MEKKVTRRNSTDVDLAACGEVARTCPAMSLRRVAHAVSRRFQQAYEGLGISGQQFSLMVGISLHPEPTVVRLATALRLDQTTMTRNIKVMIDRGLVLMVPHKEDGRVKVVRLTARGKRTLNNALESWRRARDDFEQRLGSERAAQLRSLLGETLEILGAEMSLPKEDAT